jgi:hypothetical protein
MDKKTSAFGLARMVSPDDYLDCSPRSGWFTGYVGICHLFAAYLSKLGAKGKKKNFMSIPKISKKITPSMNFTGVWPIFCVVQTDVNLARPRANPTE